MKEETINTIVIEKSRFICYMKRVRSEDEYRQYVSEIRKKHHDATHVCSAMICHNIRRSSDDGEPSGTAGRPALDVLSGRNCTNVILTITRWFGGTLLGTGGLVKAYGNGAKGVIAAANEEGAFQPLVAKKDFTFSTDYSLLKPIKNIISSGAFHFWDIKEDFRTEVTLSGQIQSDEYEAFASKLKDLSNGKILI